MLVAVEGLDGAGKNTLVRRLCTELTGRELTVATVAFPRYGVSVEADLAAQALHGQHGDLSSSVYAMAMLFALDRRGGADDLRRLLREFDVVVADRYTASNAAYSAARLTQSVDGAVVSWVADLEFGQFDLPRPDLQILLDTPEALAAQRAKTRADHDDSRTRDAYERDDALQNRTRAAYHELAAATWMSPWSVVEPDAAPSAIADQLVTLR